MGDPVRGGKGTGTTQAHCHNCHGSPETQVDSLSNLPYSRHLEGPGSILNRLGELGKAPPKDCLAQDVWPEVLKKYQPDLAQLPFWVRSNYEKTLKAHRSREGKVTLPFRIDLKTADVEIDLKPESFKSEIIVGGKQIPIEVIAGKNGQFYSHWNIQNNALDLGLATFLKVQNVEIVGPYWMSISPEEISLDMMGQIHGHFDNNWITGLAIGAYDLFVGDLPKTPVSAHYEDPTCRVFPHLLHCTPHQPHRDWNLTPFVPDTFKNPLPNLISPILTEKDRGISQIFLFENLLVKVWELFSEPKKKNSKNLDLSSLLNPRNLKPGSSVKFSLRDIQDFFVPGKIDLGPSHGEILLQVDPRHNLTLSLVDFNINLEAMDYPMPENGEREGLKLKAGTIRPGEPVEVEHQGVIRPGIHLIRSTSTGNLQIETNLSIQLERENGETVNGQVLFKGELRENSEGYQLNPVFYLSLRELSVTDQEQNFLMEPSSLEIDGKEFKFNLPNFPHNFSFPDGADFKVNLNFKGNKHLSGELSLWLMPNENGTLDIKTLIQNLQIFGNLDWHSPKGRDFLTFINIFPEKFHRPKDKQEEVYPFGLGFEVQGLDPGKDKSFNMVKHGKGHIEVFANPEGQYRAGLQLGAETFYLPGVMRKGILMNGLSVGLEVNQVQLKEEIKTATFPKLEIALNSRGSNQGILQGPVTIMQKQGQPFTVQWLPQEEKLRIEDLDWEINIRQLMLNQKARKIFIPGTRSLGLDGNLQIDFDLNAQGPVKNWTGEGKILILGDPDGEIYPLNHRGQRVGPPIFRKTKWLWKKITKIDAKGRYPIGNGRLVTWLNIASFGNGKEGPSPRKGPLVANSDPYEFRWTMGYDNQPFTPEGFRHHIGQYIIRVCLKDPICRGRLLNRKTEDGLIEEEGGER